MDGVRALSILAVLAAHLLPLGPSWMDLNFSSGLLGMSLFFALSGFLITNFLYQTPDRIAPFFIRRSMRILPLLWVYGFIVAVLIYNRWDSFGAIVTFTLNYRDAQILPGLSHLWSICVEFHFYLFIGLLIWAFGRRGFWAVPVVFLIILLLRMDLGATSNIRTHLRVDEIFAGSLAALLWQNRDHGWTRRLYHVIGKGFWLWFALLLLSCHRSMEGLMYFRPLFGFMVLTALLDHQEGWLRRFLRWNVFTYIAGISYALYIWHPLFRLGWLGEQGSKVFFYLVKRPIAIFLTFVVAHISTNTLERYFMNLGRRIEKRVSPPSSSPLPESRG
nr:acyltransferase [Paracoccus amoyensis]